jgi:glutamate--cysteine ligase
LPTGESLTIEPLIRSDHRLGLKDFDPCTILLNNDLSVGVPGILEDLHEQHLLPPLHAGWSVRRKSRHFQAYEEICKRFAKLLGIDPWLINPMYAKCGEVNFAEDQGIDGLQSQVDALLTKIRRKYKEYGINEKPFVVVKADNAAGQGILTVRDVKELDDHERVMRGREGLVSEGQVPDELIIQEGVPTYERMNDAVAEPVVMMIDRYVVGGFYRVHADRGIDEGLCSPGSRYVPLAFAGSHTLPKPGSKPGASAPNRFYMYGVIGRLAMLAAAYELEATDPDAESYD